MIATGEVGDVDALIIREVGHTVEWNNIAILKVDPNKLQIILQSWRNANFEDKN